VALGLPFAGGEFDADGAAAGFAAMLGPLFAVAIAFERFLGLIGEFALAGLQGCWH
jgi:hypothetical protein